MFTRYGINQRAIKKGPVVENAVEDSFISTMACCPKCGKRFSMRCPNKTLCALAKETPKKCPTCGETLVYEEN